MFKETFPTNEYQNTTTIEIEKIIESLKAGDSQGHDEISVKILKYSSPFISSPLNYTCNKSLPSGIFPCRLKYAEVVPLFMKDMSNYKKEQKANVKIIEEFLYCLQLTNYLQT